jgi:hypothetical protein
MKYTKHILKYSTITIVVYFMVFFVLWFGGGYTARPSGMTRDPWLGTGYPLSDTAEWQPLFGNCQPIYQWPGANLDWSGGDVAPRCDLIGWAYYPFWLLIKSKNPTYALLEKDALPYDVLNPRNLPPGFPFHPLDGRALKEGLAEITAMEEKHPHVMPENSSDSF